LKTHKQLGPLSEEGIDSLKTDPFNLDYIKEKQTQKVLIILRKKFHFPTFYDNLTKTEDFHFLGEIANDREVIMHRFKATSLIRLFIRDFPCNGKCL
jgi:hypothetical protein